MIKSEPEVQKKTTWSVTMFKLSRLSTAIFFYIFLLLWLFGYSPVAELIDLLNPLLSQVKTVPPERALLALLLLWYAFLTQLKVRWFVGLPFYIVFYPLIIVLALLFKLAAKMMIPRSDTEPEPAAQKSKKYGAFPVKRIWLVLFFLWLITFRGLDIKWAVWIPPVLAIPIWIYCLKIAYKTAISPQAIASSVIKGCTESLERQLINANKEGNISAALLSQKDLINRVLKKYPDERIASVIQRESIIIFTLSLILALVASSWFWGLIGSAIYQTDKQFLAAYNFFSYGSLSETMIWAWGCMTTGVNFPGAMAPLWLKLMHAGILATGLFQLTFLLACFAIMANSEGQRHTDEAKKELQLARSKIDETLILENTIKTGPEKNAQEASTIKNAEANDSR